MYLSIYLCIYLSIIPICATTNHLFIFLLVCILSFSLSLTHSRVPHFVIHSKLLDAHVYIIRRWVLDYLGDQKSISSLKGELIPHLVRRQGVNGPQTESQKFIYLSICIYLSIYDEYLCIYFINHLHIYLSI